MALFRLLLLAMLAVILVYTGWVGATHGWNLIPQFFAAIARMDWQGQFNLDFLGMLTLSAIWTAWRNRFGARGLGLAALAFFFGTPFLAIYLTGLIARHRGDRVTVLLGDARAAAA